jgi:hypothetical protein
MTDQSSKNVYVTPCLESDIEYRLVTGVSLPIGSGITDPLDFGDVRELGEIK